MIPGVTENTTPHELAEKAGARQGLLANFAKYVKVNENGCWVWTGSMNRYGSPKARDGKSTVEVYRALHNYVYDPIPAGQFAVRKCRNQLCVHPAHVKPGTLAETRTREPQDTCRRGHDISKPENRTGGTMAGQCKKCRSLRGRKARLRGD